MSDEEDFDPGCIVCVAREQAEQRVGLTPSDAAELATLVALRVSKDYEQGLIFGSLCDFHLKRVVGGKLRMVVKRS